MQPANNFEHLQPATFQQQQQESCADLLIADFDRFRTELVAFAAEPKLAIFALSEREQLILCINQKQVRR